MLQKERDYMEDSIERDLIARDLESSCKLINAMINQGLPKGFVDDEVSIRKSDASGCFFLTNSENQVAMMREGKIEEYYRSPYECIEGFYDEIQPQYNEMTEGGKGWFDDMNELIEGSPW